MTVDQEPAPSPEEATPQPVPPARRRPNRVIDGLSRLGFYRCAFFVYIGAALLIFTFLVPPFQKADEPAHYHRAVSLTNLDFVCEKDANGVPYFPMKMRYSEFPNEMHFWDVATLFEPPGTPKRKFDIDWLRTDFSDPRFDQPGGVYSFCGLPAAGYIPSALGILILKPLDNPIPGFYLSRIFGVLFFLGCLYLALRKTPDRYKPVVYTFAAIPMVLHQVSAVSYDVMQLPFFMLLFAYVSRFVVDRGPISRRDLLIFMGLLWFTVNIRLFSYAPLLLLFFVIDWRQIAPTFSKYLIKAGAFFWFTGVTSLLFIAVYLPTSEQRVLDQPFGTNARDQLEFVGQHPLSFLAASYETFRHEGEFLLKQNFGFFGWLDYGYNYFPYYFGVFMFGFVVYRFVEKDSVVMKPREIALILGSIGATCVLLFLSLYAVWTPVGASAVAGLQGRYFLGMLPLGALAISQLAATIGKERSVKLLFVAVALVVLYSSLRAVTMRY